MSFAEIGPWDFNTTIKKQHKTNSTIDELVSAQSTELTNTKTKGEQVYHEGMLSKRRKKIYQSIELPSLNQQGPSLETRERNHNTINHHKQSPQHSNFSSKNTIPLRKVIKSHFSPTNSNLYEQIEPKNLNYHRSPNNYCLEQPTSNFSLRRKMRIIKLSQNDIQMDSIFKNISEAQSCHRKNLSLPKVLLNIQR